MPSVCSLFMFSFCSLFVILFYLPVMCPCLHALPLICHYCCLSSLFRPGPVLVNLFFILTVPRLTCLVFSLASPVSLVGFCSPVFPRCFHTALIPPVYKLCVCPVSVPSVFCCTLLLPCQSVLYCLSLCLSYSVIVSALVFLAFIPTLIKAVILSLCLPAKSCILG